jgi:hypothetical protein
MPHIEMLETQPIKAPRRRASRKKIVKSLETALIVTDDSLVSDRDQKRFTLLVEDAHDIENKIETLKKLVDQHRIVFAQTINPLTKRQDEIKRNMVIWLNQRMLQGKLAPRVQRMLGEIITHMAHDYAIAGDEKMRDIHDLHSDVPLADLERIQMEEAQAFYDEMMKEEGENPEDFDSLEDMIQARFDQMHKQAQEKAKAEQSKNSKKQKLQDAEQTKQILDKAGLALRHIYRQLARQLHPDREPDVNIRQQKNELMSQANIAYGRQDVVALLRLQAEFTKTAGESGNLESTGASLHTFGAQSTQGLIELLQIRIKALHREQRDTELHAVAEFVLPSSRSLTAERLNQHLESIKLRHQLKIRDLKGEFVQIQNDSGLSKWLKEQALFA